MSYSQSNSGLPSSISWVLRTPSSMPRQDRRGSIGQNEGNRSALALRNPLDSASTLNYNFRPHGNRFPFGHVRNVFDYPPSSSAYGPPKREKEILNWRNHNFGFSSFNGRTGNNGYKFGLNYSPTPTYNTVHPHKTCYNSKRENDAIYDAAAEEYEDLDYYERPPVETPLPPSTLSLLQQKAITASSPYHSSNTSTTNTTGTVPTTTVVTPETTLKISSTQPPPPTLPSLVSAAVVSLKQRNQTIDNDSKALEKDKRKDKIIDESDISNDKLMPKKKNSRCCYGKQWNLCLIISLILFAAILFAFGGAFSYFLYIQNGNSTLALHDLLNNPLRLFQQNLDSITDANHQKKNEDSTAPKISGTSEKPNWKSKSLPAPEDYEDDQISTTIDFNDENNVASSRFSPNLNSNSNEKENLKNTNANTKSNTEETKGGTNDDPLIHPKHLLTLQITKRKICLFEVGTSEQEQSRRDFRTAHIPGARLLFYASLSHNGVPVHPLQFQRYIRSLGVDSNCRVIVYDRGQQIWSAYAFWIFKLYGHPKISLLNGGLEGWSRLAENALAKNASANADSAYYQMESGSGLFTDRPGNFRAAWNSDIIVTFDDVFANFDNSYKVSADIIDTQTTQEFDGKVVGANRRNEAIIFGHIRGAINIPSERLYDWKNQTWLSATKLLHVFRVEKALTDRTRPIILYDGTSLRSAMVWFALHRLHYTHAAIYFGAWPEWIIRAPDYLKVIPNGE